MGEKCCLEKTAPSGPYVLGKPGEQCFFAPQMVFISQNAGPGSFTWSSPGFPAAEESKPNAQALSKPLQASYVLTNHWPKTTIGPSSVQGL